MTRNVCVDQPKLISILHTRKYTPPILKNKNKKRENLHWNKFLHQHKVICLQSTNEIIRGRVQTS